MAATWVNFLVLTGCFNFEFLFELLCCCCWIVGGFDVGFLFEIDLEFKDVLWLDEAGFEDAVLDLTIELVPLVFDTFAWGFWVEIILVDGVVELLVIFFWVFPIVIVAVLGASFDGVTFWILGILAWVGGTGMEEELVAASSFLRLINSSAAAVRRFFSAAFFCSSCFFWWSFFSSSSYFWDKNVK